MKYNKKIKNIFSLLLATIVSTKINLVNAVNPKDTPVKIGSAATSELIPTPNTDIVTVINPTGSQELTTMLQAKAIDTVPRVLAVGKFNNGSFNVPTEFQKLPLCFSCLTQESTKNGITYTIIFQIVASSPNEQHPISQIPIPFSKLNLTCNYAFVLSTLQHPSVRRSSITHIIPANIIPTQRLLLPSTPTSEYYTFECVLWGELRPTEILKQQRLLPPQTLPPIQAAPIDVQQRVTQIVIRITKHIDTLAMNPHYQQKISLIRQTINKSSLSPAQKEELTTLLDQKIESLEAEAKAKKEAAEDAKKKAEEEAKKEAEATATQQAEKEAKVKKEAEKSSVTHSTPTGAGTTSQPLQSSRRVKSPSHRPPTRKVYTLHNPEEPLTPSLLSEMSSQQANNAPTETQSAIIPPTTPRSTVDRIRNLGGRSLPVMPTINITWVNERIRAGNGQTDLTEISALKSNDGAYIAFAKGVAILKDKDATTITDVNSATKTLQEICSSFQRDKISIMTLQKLL